MGSQLTPLCPFKNESDFSVSIFFFIRESTLSAVPINSSSIVEWERVPTWLQAMSLQYEIKVPSNLGGVGALDLLLLTCASVFVPHNIELYCHLLVENMYTSTRTSIWWPNSAKNNNVTVDDRVLRKQQTPRLKHNTKTSTTCDQMCLLFTRKTRTSTK